MINQVQITNYKSILDATVQLSPFTLLIGANGTGKSNFLDFLSRISLFIDENHTNWKQHFIGTSHFNQPDEPQTFTFISKKKGTIFKIMSSDFEQSESGKEPELTSSPAMLERFKIEQGWMNLNVALFSIDPKMAGVTEPLTDNPIIQSNGAGTVQVLDTLKTGEREDLFELVEEKLTTFIDEIEKLNFISTAQGKYLQVKIRDIDGFIAVNQLSEGMQLTLILLSILYQEDRPSIICIEDIDKALEPRLYGKIIELCFELTRRKSKVQIIATSHNPYILKHFKNHKDAVLIVEKNNGNTCFTTLTEHIKDLGDDEDLLSSLKYYPK